MRECVIIFSLFQAGDEIIAVSQAKVNGCSHLRHILSTDKSDLILTVRRGLQYLNINLLNTEAGTGTTQGIFMKGNGKR